MTSLDVDPPLAGTGATRRGATLVLLLAAVPSVPWFVGLIGDVPPLVVGAAALPALLYAWGIVRIDRHEPEPRLALATALLAGAVVAAHLSHMLIAQLLASADASLGSEQARPLIAGFGAPVIEELTKAVVLVALALAGGTLVRGALDGIVYGALVGIGFAFSENVVYLTFAVLQGGEAGLLQAVYIRALLGGCNHAAFTATTGAAIGHVLGTPGTRGRLWLVAIGLALAIVQHVAWNAVAALAINGVLCGPELAGGPCRPHPTGTSLFVLVPALVTIFLGPGVLTLGAIARLSSRHRSADAGRTAART
jgi:RsiW-degrading membrane proteinase PrsW (M82 family)